MSRYQYAKRIVARPSEILHPSIPGPDAAITTTAIPTTAIPTTTIPNTADST